MRAHTHIHRHTHSCFLAKKHRLNVDKIVNSNVNQTLFAQFRSKDKKPKLLQKFFIVLSHIVRDSDLWPLLKVLESQIFA